MGSPFSSPDTPSSSPVSLENISVRKSSLPPSVVAASPLDQWLRWALPVAPDAGSPLSELEKYRRIRLGAMLLLILFALAACGLLTALIFGSFRTLGLLSVVELISFFAILLNRTGRTVLAGILFVGLYTVGIYISFAVKPEMGLSNVIGYDLLAVGVLLAVAFFPPWSVFIIALFNSTFICIDLFFHQRHPLLDQLIQREGIQVVLERTITLQVMTAVLSYLWVQSAHKAIFRADRAEIIARLQQDLSERDRALTDQNVKLEQAVQQVMATLTSYSNGDLNARVPLTQDNVLWHVAGSINNLLGRVQRLRYLEVELDKLRPLAQRAHELEREVTTLRATLQRRSEDERRSR